MAIPRTDSLARYTTDPRNNRADRVFTPGAGSADGQVPGVDSRARTSTEQHVPDAGCDRRNVRQRTAELNKIAEARGQSLTQLALQWVLRRQEVTSALIGASSTEQLDHNIAALNFPPLTDEELALIEGHGVHGTGLRL